MTRAGRWLRLDPERQESLLFSSPYLIFVSLPVIEVVKSPLQSWRGPAVLTLLTTMIMFYLLIWVLCPKAPPGRSAKPLFLALFSLLSATIVAMLTIGGRDYASLLFMTSYATTCWVLLAPRHLVFAGSALIPVVTAGVGIILKIPPITIMIAVLVTTVSASAVWISRFSIDKGRGHDFRKEQEHQMMLERERSQMTSDLHDLLGQDLTSLSIKSDLADKLLAAGRVEEARAELRDLARLSRQSLDDVRSVVKKGRAWSLDREIASASDLLAARDTTLHLDLAEVALPGPRAGALARVVRESVTNMVHHADPQNCWITLRPGTLILENDGYSAKKSARTRGSGCGLASLSAAVELFGTLSWGPGGRGWRVEMKEVD